MYSGVYKIADHVFRIESIYDEIHTMCADYASLMEPEFSISISADDITMEREESRKTALKEGSDPDRDFPESYLETLAVYRKLCVRLLDGDILLVHGSCLSIDGLGCLFVASSGTGKSTHTRNWRKVFGNRVLMVNDDKPLVNVSTMQIYGTPWDGKHHISCNTSVPLRCVVILARGAENRIRRIDQTDALNRMMMQTYLPADNLLKIKTFALLGKLMQNLSFYVLECNMDPLSAQVAYDGMPELHA